MYKVPKMDWELLHRHALLYMNTVLSFLIVTEHDAQRSCLHSGGTLKHFTVPRHQTLNEDNTFTLHITPPLRKHFVGSSKIFSSLHSKPCLSALVNVARPFIGQSDSAALIFFS
jgi:hypothetical protein